MTVDSSAEQRVTCESGVPEGRFRLPGLARQLRLMLALTENTPSIAADLQTARDTLLAPLRLGVRNGVVSDEVDVIVADGGQEAAAAETMRNYGYCSHYFTGTGAPHLPAERPIPGADVRTLVARIWLSGEPVVIATVQVVTGPSVPALSLFVPRPGAVLPHRAGDLVAELRRFSLNPAFEAVAAPDDPLNCMMRDWRSLIYRGLYYSSLQLLRGSGAVVVYGIATPEIYRFFTRSGMPMQRIDDAVQVDSVEMRALQRRFGAYWRPHADTEQQPKLYEILSGTHDSEDRAMTRRPAVPSCG